MSSPHAPARPAPTLESTKERGCGRNNNTLPQFMLHCNKNGVTLSLRSRFASDGAIDAAQ
jgi:hypothetical protein